MDRRRRPPAAGALGCARRLQTLAGHVLWVLVLAAPATRVDAQISDGTGAVPPGVAGHVVRLDGDDVIVHVEGLGVEVGARLLVYRTIRVRHPVTRQQIVDRFVIAHLDLVQVGQHLAMARTVTAPDRLLEVGDELQSPAPVRAPEPISPGITPDESGPATAQPGAPVLGEERRALLTAFEDTLGVAPAERIARLQRYLAEWPEASQASLIQRDIEALERAERVAARGMPLTGAQLTRYVIESVRGRVHAEAHSFASAGQPVEVAAVVEPSMGAAVAELRELVGIERLALFVRAIGEAEFAQIDMPLDDVGHARARLPENLVWAPGFEYFIVAVASALGRSVAVVGDAANPRRVSVAAVDDSPLDERPRARVRIRTEIASFDGQSGDDWFFAGEADFLYRLRRRFVLSLRAGYGHFRGKGPSDIDDPTTVRDAGFTYGFVETEIALHRLFGVMPRLTIGLGSGDTTTNTRIRGGFQLRLRIGTAEGTRLVVGAETIPEIGQRAFLGLFFEARESWPMAVEVEVTDQPVDEGELAVRTVFEVGRRFVDVFVTSLRLSYQGRSIDHAGLGAGLALTFDW